MSKVRIACPNCQKRLSVLPSLNGKKAKCPKCETVFRIKIPQEPPVAQPISEEPSQPDLMNMDFGFPPHSPVVQPVQQPGYLAPSTPPSGLPPRTINQNARAKKKKKVREENDWSCVGWGVALLFVAFISAAMPGMDELGRGGRGITKLIATVLFMLGPYAPLVGILVGLGGLALIIYGLKGFPKLVTYIGGGVAAFFLLLVCGLSFVSAMGFLTLSGSSSGSVSSTGGGGVLGPDEMKALHELEVREMYDGEPLFMFEHEGFSKAKVPLKFGDFVGEEGRAGEYFHGPNPIHGIVFANSFAGNTIALCKEGESSEFASSARDGEAVSSFNLNFRDGLLVGIQPAFGQLKDNAVDSSSVRKGEWLGMEAGGEFEVISGNGKLIYGFAINEGRHDEIVGFELIVEK